MTKDEAIGRFKTVSSAEESADLILECFRIFGHAGTEKILIEISQGEAGSPFCSHIVPTNFPFLTVKQSLDTLFELYPSNKQKPKKRVIFIDDEWYKLNNPEKE